MKYIYLTVLTLTQLIFSLSAQEKTKIELNNFYKIAAQSKEHTSDLFYFFGTSDKYLLNESPLKFFPNYKKMYDKFPEVEGVEIQVFDEFEPADNKFQVKWVLYGNILYLSDISFYTINQQNINKVFRNKKQYKILEKFTGTKFNKKLISNNCDTPSGPVGMMPAKWVTGKFYIKRAWKPGKEDYEKWENEPFYELTFDKGKLLSMKRRNNF